MTDLAAAATEVFQIFQTYNYTVMLYDKDGEKVQDPADARRMISRPEDLQVDIIDDGDNSTIRLYIGKKTDISGVFGLIQSLRTAANSKFNLLFNVREYGKEISPKDFAGNNFIQESRAYYAMLLTEGMYGTSRSSYLSLPEARMIVRHSAKIDETKLGARGRCIESIFIENAKGERFLFPTRNLAPARAMTQHVNHHGSFDDHVGKRLLCMAEDYANLAECSRHVYHNSGSLTEGAGKVREACRDKMGKMRKVFEKMCRPNGYQTEAAHIEEMANALIEGDEGTETNFPPEEIEEMRSTLAVEGVDELSEGIFESACRAMKESGDDIENSEAASSLSSSEKPVDEAIDSAKYLSILGQRVNADAWEALRHGRIDLSHRPDDRGEDLHPAFTSKSAEMAFKLGEIVPCLADDSMANLVSHVVNRMPEERNPETLKKMRILAMTVMKTAGLLSNGLAENNAVVRELAEWVKKFGVIRSLSEAFDPDQLGGFFSPLDGPKDDDAVDADDKMFGRDEGNEGDFDADAFFNSPEVQKIINGHENDKTLTHEAVIDALTAFLTVTGEEGSSQEGEDGDEDGETVGSPLVDRAIEKLEQEGFTVSGGEGESHDLGMDEDLELSREDILLPPDDQGLNLKREVVKKSERNPDTGEEQPMDGGYVDRLRTLSGISGAKPFF